MSGEGDLDPTEGHSQLSVGTLPLTDKDPPKNPEDTGPPQEPSFEGPTSDSPESNTRDKKSGNIPPPEKSKQSVDCPSEYPPQDQPETPIDPGENLEKPPAKRSQKDPIANPFSRFWSGVTAGASDKDKKTHRWLTRKPKRRHSFELETLHEQDKRSYKYVLKEERDLPPRPRFYSRCPDASSISLEYVEFILRHIAQQRHQELEQERLEREKKESERRRQSELPIDITDKPKRLIPVDPIISPFDSGEDKVPGADKPKRLIPVDPIISPFDSGEDKVPGEETYIPYRPTEHPFSSDTGLESPSSPLRLRFPIPHKETTDSEDSIDSEMDSIMTATTKELIDTLTKTLKNINQSPTIPLPVFKGKKGEDPEDHILKAEDYFGVHQITEQRDKIDRFKDTLFETARKWAQTLNYTEVTRFDYDPANADDKIASMKYLFLARFAKEGRTLESAYSAWGALTFDPNKDDIEQFILKVEELAKKLGYNQDAQVMAVKSVLPRDVYGIYMTYKTLKELKAFLIELFSNPKMREAVPGTANTVADPGVFSIGQHIENNMVNPTAADVSKIRQDMNDLQVRFNKITSADFRSKSSKPWKPEVTPPRRRGGFNRGRGGRQFDNVQRNDRFKNNESNSNQDRDNGQRNYTGNFRGRGQGRENFRGNMRGKGRGRGRFDKSPNVRRPRVASKTVDKDKMRCHYCNEYGHFIKEYSKKNRDENKTGHFNGMSMDCYENDLFTGEDYDDDVFATLNS